MKKILSGLLQYKDGTEWKDIPALDGQQGDKGDIGNTPNLSIGTVTELLPTESPSATLTGTTANPVLNLGIPKGATGQATEETLAPLLVDKADVIVDTASGAIATFSDGANNLPIKQMTVNIAPVQSGSGDPSPTNIRPITGYTQADISRYGANAFTVADANWKNKYYLSDSGVETSSNNYKYSQEYFPISPSTTYYVSYTKTTANSAGFHVCLYDSSKTFISREVIHSSTSSTGEFTGTIMTTASTAYFRISCAYSATAEGTGTTDIFIANGTTHTISFPSEAGTVYGGTLVINEDGSAVLMVDMQFITLDGNTIISTHTEGDATHRPSFRTNNVLPYACPTINDQIVISSWAIQEINTGSAAEKDVDYWSIRGLSGGTSKQLIAYGPIGAEVTENQFLAMLTANPLQVAINITTPIVYNLTAQQITTLLGINNIWANTGDVSVEYRADTKLYIDRKVSSLV